MKIISKFMIFKNFKVYFFNQKKIFRSQMEIAKDLNMPVIFHNRDADEDVLSILKEFPGVEGVAHCFSSTEETARKFIELG